MCQRKPRGTRAPEPEEIVKLKVVASTTVLAELARQIGGEYVEVDSLLGANEPPPWRRTGPLEGRLMTADVLVVLGLGYEAVLAPSIQRALDAGVALCSLEGAFPQEKLLAQAAGAEGIDPHVWMNPELWSHAVGTLVESISKLVPAHAQKIESNGFARRFDLRELLTVIQRRVSLIPAGERSLVTSNAGLRYLGEATALSVTLGPTTRRAAELKELESLQLDALQAATERIVVRAEVHDLSTLDGLIKYAVDLVVLATS